MADGKDAQIIVRLAEAGPEACCVTGDGRVRTDPTPHSVPVGRDDPSSLASAQHHVLRCAANLDSQRQDHLRGRNRLQLRQKAQMPRNAPPGVAPHVLIRASARRSPTLQGAPDGQPLRSLRTEPRRERAVDTAMTSLPAKRRKNRVVFGFTTSAAITRIPRNAVRAEDSYH